MPQEELTIAFKIKPAGVPIYAKALAALTGREEPPVGATTAEQMHILWRAWANAGVVKYERETTLITPPETT